MGVRNDARLFVKLCKQSAHAWVDGNNSGDPRILESKNKESEKLGEQAEAIAIKYGCSCSWPGLYPVLKRNRHELYATSDSKSVARFFKESTK